MQRRLELARRAVAALKEDAAAPAEAVRDKVLAGSGGGPQLSLDALDAEAGFLSAQLEALHKVGAA
jgi:hypothetical protein